MPDHDMPDHDPRALLRPILAGYVLRRFGTHGVSHWARVHDNGARLAAETGADGEIVALFALFHDARREYDGHDPEHGWRGADLADSLRGSLIHLDDTRFDRLYEACRLHTEGEWSDDVTIQACWDADRLDLGRVGVRPDPERLGSPAARALIPWAHARAGVEEKPRATLRAWGIAPGGPRR